MNATSSSAASQRSAGSIRPARSRTGTSGPSASGTTTSPSQRAISVAIVVSAENGTLPVTASMSTRPSAYTSALPSTLWPCACSGGGVARRAQQHALWFGPRRLGDGASQAEVTDAEPSLLAEEEVGGLDVAMHEPLPVGVFEASRRVEADQQRLRRRQAVAGVEHRPQAPAPEVLAHEVRDALVRARVVHVHHVGVVERGGGLGLGPEALEERRVVRHALVEHLDRDAPPQLRVVGQVDAARRTVAQRGDDAISTREDTADEIAQVRQRHEPEITGAPRPAR